MRKRYRVRSKRRLTIAICVLLLLLLLAGLAVMFFLKDDTKSDGSPSPAPATEESSAAAPEEPDAAEESDAADEQAADEAAAQDESAQDAEEPPLSPVAVSAKETAKDNAKDSESDSDSDSDSEGDSGNDGEAETDDSSEAPAVPLFGNVHDTTAGMIEGRRSAWQLLLVNEWNTLPEDYSFEILTLLNGMDIDARAADDLDAMIDDCYNAGYHPEIASAYRSPDYQQQLFDEVMYNYIYEGYSEDEARAMAEAEIAKPGTSEHQTGLAVDIVDYEYQATDEQQAETGTQKWLLEHCWEYGFILRYPADKQAITGKIYEPWHYRYVGKEYAKQMHEEGLCLEEFIWQTDHPETEASGAD